MSEPKIVSPLLDNYLIGDPISDHHGIRCCPAMDKNTEEKYIVKIISVPASPTQVDALLLTGALSGEDEARQYFHNRAIEITEELNCLQALAKQEGFLPCTGYQIVPMEDEIGFDVYILTPYYRSLERQMEKQPLSQLDAMNLALDVCAALTAARRNGFLFINLKPSNLYITSTGEYKLCDLGLLKLSGLSYATIPDHYIDEYTPPEISDAFSPLNTTIDVYSVGRLLYCLYNGGELPSVKQIHIAPPQYAEEELAQIILKAIHTNPEERWQDPAQLGQMLVSYVQKNGIENLPIIPPAPDVPETTVHDSDEESVLSEEAVMNPSDSLSTDDVENIENTSADVSSDLPIEGSTNAEDVSADPIEQATIDAEANNNETQAVIVSAREESEDTSAEASSSTPTQDLLPDSDLDPFSIDDLPNTDDISYSEVTTEVSQILSQADELAALEVPDPVVAPDPIPVELPNDTEHSDAIANDAPATNEEDEPLVPTDPPLEYPEDENNDEDPVKQHFPWKRILWGIVGVLLLIGGFLFYRFYVMQTIEEIQVIGNKDQLTVVLTTKTDEDLLTISCTDIYGKKIIVPVANGRAEFSGLLPDTEYTVQAHIDGLHILTGETEATYFTPTETSIVQFTVVTGNIPGTAILSFTVSGPNSDNWKFTYSTSVGKENIVTFSGNSVTLTDLDENQFYSGVLEPEDDLFITQTPEITFTANEVIQAGDLIITDCTDGKLSVSWTSPERVTVESWSVHCFSDTGYDETITTMETQAVFQVPDNTDSFTVEVTAAGQSVSQRTTIGENSVTVKNLHSELTDNGKIRLSWDSSRELQDGWIVSYTVNNSESVFHVTAEQNSVLIVPAIPDSEYKITVRAADATPTVCQPLIFKTDETETFSVNYYGNLVTADNLHFSMCKRTGLNWSHLDLRNSDYTNTFSVGQLAGLVVFVDRRYDISNEDIVAAFIIRDENDQIVSIETSTRTWSNMWYKNYCELNIPSLPDTPGDYSIFIYFNGQFVNNQTFSVVE